MFYKCSSCSFELESKIAPGKCPNCNSVAMFQTVPVKIEQNEIIAGFKLIKRLGQGGMGEVWLAEQTSMERLVALKILKPEFGSAPNFRNRFINEIKNSAKLEHPNIVTAFDAGIHKGLYYLASSFIKGKQLLQKLDEEKIIQEKEALSIALGIAKALAYAWNEFNMLHRDIKPGNIIVDIASVPKLLDMGIAKTITDDNSLTMDGDLVGTPFYISPEQAKSEALDFRSDIYSLGATLYHITTGSIPFQGSSAMGIIAKHITEELKPPIDINNTLSIATNDLIVKMMAKDKNNRFYSWETVINRIENILSYAVLHSHNSETRQIEKKYITNVDKSQKDVSSLIGIQKLKTNERSLQVNDVLSRSIPNRPWDNNKLNREKLDFKQNVPYVFIATAAIFVMSVAAGIIFLLFSQGLWLRSIDRILSTLIFSFMTILAKSVYGLDGSISGLLELKKVIIFNFIPVILLFSAFWSGALAEKYFKNRFYYFILGILFPIIHPILIARRNKINHDIEGNFNLVSKNTSDGNKNLEQYKYNLFKKISYKEDGSSNGPFRFELMNDTILDVIKILEVKSNQLSIEIKTESGNLKKIKIPFSSIKTFIKV